MAPPATGSTNPINDECVLKENIANHSIEDTKQRQIHETDSKQRVHVEVLVKSLCPTPMSTLREQWQTFLNSNDLSTLVNNKTVNLIKLPEDLRVTCQRATVVVEHGATASANDIQIHVYKLSEEEAAVEELEPSDGDNEWTAACDNLTLPHVSLDGVWDSLILARGIKTTLLQYALSALLFSDMGVSPNIVSWNRLLLLHGPPGTGKTTLCRALSQKLSIRLGHCFPSGATLLEIHSHSLFSKWFSTSGKLVSRLFELVREMVQEDPKALVVVLIDEIESLAGSRTSVAGAGEPSDAMRAVNALLTSLDRLRSFSNVLVLATSNLTSSVDVAFLDRADLKVYVGLPILEARYEILRGCLMELARVGIIQSEKDGVLCDFDDIYETVDEQNVLSRALLKCAEAAEGLSGRSLRRLPLQSHALYVQSTEKVSMESFIEALRLGITAEQESREHLDDSA